VLGSGGFTLKRAVQYAFVLHLAFYLLVMATMSHAKPKPLSLPVSSTQIVKASLVKATDVMPPKPEPKPEAKPPTKKRKVVPKSKVKNKSKPKVEKKATPKPVVKKKVVLQKKKVKKAKQVDKPKKISPEKADEKKSDKIKSALKEMAQASLAEAQSRERFLQEQATFEQARMQSEKMRYMGRISQIIRASWINQLGDEDLNVTLRIRLTNLGEVEQVSVLETSGNKVFDRQAKYAVEKASPLPMPSDPLLQSQFRVIILPFSNL